MILCYGRNCSNVVVWLSSSWDWMKYMNRRKVTSWCLSLFHRLKKFTIWLLMMRDNVLFAMWSTLIVWSFKLQTLLNCYSSWSLWSMLLPTMFISQSLIVMYVHTVANKAMRFRNVIALLAFLQDIRRLGRIIFRTNSLIDHLLVNILDNKKPLLMRFQQLPGGCLSLFFGGSYNFGFPVASVDLRTVAVSLPAASYSCLVFRNGRFML